MRGIDFPDVAWQAGGRYHYDQQVGPNDVGKWYTGHELGHVLVHGLRSEGIDLAELYRNRIVNSPLERGHPNEDVATAIGLGALARRGTVVGSDFRPDIQDFANIAFTYLRYGSSLSRYGVPW